MAAGTRPIWPEREESEEALPVELLRRRVLHRAMERELTDRQREILTLYYKENLSFSAIAERLGVQPSTVSRTYARGLRRLRRLLEYCK